MQYARSWLVQRRVYSPSLLLHLSRVATQLVCYLKVNKKINKIQISVRLQLYVKWKVTSLLLAHAVMCTVLFQAKLMINVLRKDLRIFPYSYSVTTICDWLGRWGQRYFTQKEEQESEVWTTWTRYTFCLPIPNTWIPDAWGTYFKLMCT